MLQPESLESTSEGCPYFRYSLLVLRGAQAVTSAYRGPKPAASAMRTSSGRFLACILVITLARCTSTVLGLMLRS